MARLTSFGSFDWFTLLSVVPLPVPLVSNYSLQHGKSQADPSRSSLDCRYRRFFRLRLLSLPDFIVLLKHGSQA